LPQQYEKAITITFISIIFSQYANLLSRRTVGNVISKYLFSNRNLIFAFLFSITCVILIVYVPLFNLYFHTAALSVTDWILTIFAGIISLTIYEIRKKILHRLNLSKV
jgi:Ca2+-transporting ATPase